MFYFAGPYLGTPPKNVDLCFLEGEWCGGNHFRPLPYQRQQTLGTHLIRQLIEIARNGRTTKWTSIQLCNPQYLFFLSLANFQQLFSRVMITNSQLHEKGEKFLNKIFQLCNNLWRTYITNSKNKVARYGEISTTPLLPIRLILRGVVLEIESKIWLNLSSPNT